MSWQQQFLKFTGVGAIGTSAHYCVLFAMVEGLGISVITASVCGYMVGAVINYALNYYWTFESQNEHGYAASRFGMIALAGLLFNTLLMLVFYQNLQIGYVYSQILSTAIVLIFNFLSNKLLTFS